MRDIGDNVLLVVLILLSVACCDSCSGCRANVRELYCAPVAP